MVAVIRLYIDTAGSDGTPANNIDTTPQTPNLRFRTDDLNTDDNVSPIPIPGAGTNYSFWKSCYFQCTQAPGTQVDNFRLYTDGAGYDGGASGIFLSIGNAYPVRANGNTTGYEVATGVVGTSGDRMDSGANQHSGLTGAADVFSFTSGVPLTFPASFIQEAGSIINAINETTSYFILQASVDNSATPGTKTAETITILYDEV
jgi:hypothetical protein